MPVKRKPTLFNVVSLFSGCGGADLGFLGGFEYLGEVFKQLPFQICWANDFDRFASSVYQHNFATSISESDIADIDFGSLDLPAIDVLVAGIPCQDFALLGPRGGLQSHRGQMYKHVRRALRVLNPKIFLVENVPGIEHPPTTIRSIRRALAGRQAPNYRARMFRINAADYGLPQLRKRVLLIGIRSDLNLEFSPPVPTRAHADMAHDLVVRPWLTARAAIDDLWSESGPGTSTVPDQDKVTNATIILDKPKRRDKRLDPNLPAPTIRAEHHGHVELHYRSCDDGSLRHLTIRECARLQGFPDTFTFPVSFTQGYRQIGNAMPPIVLHRWASSIATSLEQVRSEASVAPRKPRDPLVTSKIMAAIKSRGSRAELALAEALWTRGLRYRKHPKGIYGKPDFAFPGNKVAVFCDGDFWHGLGWQDRGFNSWEEQFDNIRNPKFWREKIHRNMRRDRDVNEQLKSEGWTVVRLRESDILRDTDRCVSIIHNALGRAICKGTSNGDVEVALATQRRRRQETRVGARP